MKKDWLIPVCIVILGVLGFRERERWVSHTKPPTAVSAQPRPSTPKDESLPISPSAGAQLAFPSPESADLAKLIAQSQQAALARYPALGVLNSEIGIRFNFRSKRLVDENSPRLQDPAWPLQLADECAQAAGVRPVTAHPAPTPAGTTSKTASIPPVPAAAQPLDLRSPNAGAPQTTGSLPFASAPKSSGPLPFVTLEAVNQKSANHYTYNTGYDDGWYDLSFRQSAGIAMTIRNMSRDPVAVNLRWIFFARQTYNNERFVFGASSKEFSIAPGQIATAAADSPLLQRREISDAWLGERYLSGSKYEGWLVQLIERGSNRIITQTGSTGYLEDLARKTDFTTLLDDYRAKLRSQTDAEVRPAAVR